MYQVPKLAGWTHPVSFQGEDKESSISALTVNGLSAGFEPNRKPILCEPKDSFHRYALRIQTSKGPLQTGYPLMLVSGEFHISVCQFPSDHLLQSKEV